MKHLLPFLVLTFLSCEKTFAQKETSFPLSVSIKIEKEYELKFPKEYFSYEQINITSDSVKQKQYDIKITLKNNSTKPIFIWLMLCSWDHNFIINNNYMFFLGIPCNKNFPKLIEFKPGEAKIYTTTLQKTIKFENPCNNCIYGPQVETTKLGLIIIDDFFKPRLEYTIGYDLAIEDKSLWKMVWSNPLYLLSKNELKYGRP
jgi:hypothetical protein